MTYDLLDVITCLFGALVGFALTNTLLKRKAEKNEIKNITEKSTSITEVVKKTKMETTPIDIPVEEKIISSFKELVDYLRDKYMLLNLTLATTEGLPIESNSPTAEEDAAIAPEMFRTLKRITDSDKYVISSKNEKIIIFEVNSDVVAHARVSRDMTYIEIDKLKEEIKRYLEVLI